MDPIDLSEIADTVYKGPFHARQVAIGGSFYEDLGNLWTRSFDDPVGEYWAVKRGTGLWDVSALAKWRFTGPDALAALDRLFTRDLCGASAGTIRYGAVLNEHGRMFDEGTAFILPGEEAYYMGNEEREPFVEHVRGHTADLRVRVENVTREIPNIAVQGPGSLELLSHLTRADLGALGYFRFFPEPVELAGARGFLSRTGFTGEVGYELFLLEGDAERVWDAILAAGARPFGLDAVEMMRVEQGLVISEEDYFPGETDPYDLSLDAFIDPGGEFIGKAAAVATAAAPPRRLKTLAIEGDEVPEHGETVAKDGESVGEVTSADRSPRFGVLALVVLRAEVARDGEVLEVDGRQATVGPVPFDAEGRARSDPRHPLRIA